MSPITPTILKEKRRLVCVYMGVVCCLIFVVSVLFLEAADWRELRHREAALLETLAKGHESIDNVRDAQRFALRAARSDDSDFETYYEREIAHAQQFSRQRFLLVHVADDAKTERLLWLRDELDASLERLAAESCVVERGSLDDCLASLDATADDARNALELASRIWEHELEATRAAARSLERVAAATLTIVLTLMAIVLVGMARRQMLAFGQIIGACERIDTQLHEDPLTGLMNRRMIGAMVEAYGLGQDTERLACLYLDIDGFKQVNDALGHPEGDKLLRMVSTLIRENVRRDDIVARMGGDEFVVWIAGFVTYADLAELAQRLVDRISALSNHFYDGACSIGVSVGVSVYPDMALTPADLVSSADEAMYRAKREGKSRYVFANEGGAGKRRNFRETHREPSLV